MDLLRGSLAQARAALERGDVSSEALTAGAIAAARRVQPVINAFLRIDEGRAIETARRLDSERVAAREADGLLPPLHGIPMAHKDMFYRSGRASSGGSRILGEQVQSETSAALAALDRAGAVEFGVLGMSEFALGVTGHNVHFGDVCNPWNPAHVTGGSSSGSAASVAAGANYAALGSDTGASVRVPASCNGVVGIKTSFGAVSRAGAMPLSQSLDTIGVLARTVEDCAEVFAAIAGHDPADPPTRQWPFAPGERLQRRGDLAGLRVGVAANFGHDACTADVAAAMRTSLEALRARGAELVDVSMPDPAELNRLATVVLQAEPAALHRPWIEQRPQDYSPQVLARLRSGLEVTAVQYIDALRARSPLLARVQEEVFAHCDVLHAPVLSFPVPTRAETDVGAGPGMATLLGGFARWTRPINYLGLPALSVPAGFAGGLPVGAQLIGPMFSEPLLFAVGRLYQAEIGFSAWRPALAG